MAEQIIAFATTKVSADKTAGEIEEMLRKADVTKVAKEYESGRVKAIYFQMDTPEGSHPFMLPVNVDAVYWMMISEKRATPRYRAWDTQYVKAADKAVREQAERTAWRIIHWWLKAQLALVQTQMRTVTEVFFADMMVGDGQTLYERLKEGNFTALGAGGQKQKMLDSIAQSVADSE